MYTIQLPTGEYLDTPPKLTLQFELNNQVFATSDSSILSGSFSFPVNLPLSPKNCRLLDNPHLVTNSRSWKKIDGCWAYCYGVPMFYGTLSITGCTGKEVGVAIIANPVRNLKSVPLNELDLGGDREIGNSAAMLAHAKATAADPLDYDYAFCSVINDGFLTQGADDRRGNIQNYWNKSTQVFEVDQDAPALMPFLRMDYLLERIFASTEFHFNNQFHVEDELRGLLLYNNRSLWNNGLPTTINLRNHVSKTKSTDFLRKAASTFNLGLFTNVFSKTVSLIPLRNLLSRMPRHDWSKYAIGDPGINPSDGNVPDIYDFQVDGDEAEQHYNKGLGPVPSVLGTWETFYDLQEDPEQSFIEGYYYIIEAGGYYYYDPGALLPSMRWQLISAGLGPAPSRSGETFQCLLPSLHDYWLRDFWGPFLPPGVSSGNMPICRIPGTVTYTPTGGEQEVQSNDCPDRMIMYRGMRLDADTISYPLASTTPYRNLLNTKIGNHSLRLQDEDGLYLQWFAAWHNMLKNGKHVTWSFTLPLAVLIQFSFEDEVRIHNMDYFVKKLRVGKTLGRGLVLVEASLVSVV